MSDLAAPLLMALTAGAIITVATLVARRRDRRDRNRSRNIGDVSISGDGGVGNSNDGSPLHHYPDGMGAHSHGGGGVEGGGHFGGTDGGGAAGH